ncbi:hypothetical protein BGW42_007097, partial [Actinomortierella wolfii]
MEDYEWWYDGEYSTSICNSRNSRNPTEEIDECFYDDPYDDEVEKDEEADDDDEPWNPMFVWDEVDQVNDNIIVASTALSSLSRSYATITISGTEYPSLAMAALMNTTEKKRRTSATNEVPCLRDGNGPKHIGRKWMHIDRTIDSRPVVDHTDHDSSTTSAYNHDVNPNYEDDGSSYDPGYHPGRRFQVIPFQP